MESLKKFFRTLVTYFYVPPVIVLLLCLGACSTIMFNIDTYWDEVCVGLALLLVVVQPIIFVAALIQRRWLRAFFTFILFVVCLVFTFLSLLGVSIHPKPYLPEPEEDTLLVDTLAVCPSEEDTLMVDSILP